MNAEGPLRLDSSYGFSIATVSSLIRFYTAITFLTCTYNWLPFCISILRSDRLFSLMIVLVVSPLEGTKGFWNLELFALHRVDFLWLSLTRVFHWTQHLYLFVACVFAKFVGLYFFASQFLFSFLTIQRLDFGFKVT